MLAARGHQLSLHRSKKGWRRPLLAEIIKRFGVARQLLLRSSWKYPPANLARSKSPTCCPKVSPERRSGPSSILPNSAFLFSSLGQLRTSLARARSSLADAFPILAEIGQQAAKIGRCLGSIDAHWPSSGQRRLRNLFCTCRLFDIIGLYKDVSLTMLAERAQAYAPCLCMSIYSASQLNTPNASSSFARPGNKLRASCPTRHMLGKSAIPNFRLKNNGFWILLEHVVFGRRCVDFYPQATAPQLGGAQKNTPRLGDIRNFHVFFPRFFPWELAQDKNAKKPAERPCSKITGKTRGRFGNGCVAGWHATRPCPSRPYPADRMVTRMRCSRSAPGEVSSYAPGWPDT